MDDAAVAAAQLGRAPRSAVHVVSRCHLGLPVVTRVPPLLDDGTPFPTLYWLNCPLAVSRVSRIESDGGVSAAEAIVAADPLLQAAMTEADHRYRSERDAMLPPGHRGPAPSGGVGGGSGRGVKCLHAHYADHAAGNGNPVGAWVAGLIEPLDCSVRCVADVDGVVVANPAWKEPGR